MFRGEQWQNRLCGLPSDLSHLSVAWSWPCDAAKCYASLTSRPPGVCNPRTVLSPSIEWDPPLSQSRMPIIPQRALSQALNAAGCSADSSTGCAAVPFAPAPMAALAPMTTHVLAVSCRLLASVFRLDEIPCPNVSRLSARKSLSSWILQQPRAPSPPIVRHHQALIRGFEIASFGHELDHFSSKLEKICQLNASVAPYPDNNIGLPMLPLHSAVCQLRTQHLFLNLICLSPCATPDHFSLNIRAWLSSQGLVHHLKASPIICAAPLALLPT